jgi:hypothetical protein
VILGIDQKAVRIAGEIPSANRFDDLASLADKEAAAFRGRRRPRVGHDRVRRTLVNCEV